MNKEIEYISTKYSREITDLLLRLDRREFEHEEKEFMYVFENDDGHDHIYSKGQSYWIRIEDNTLVGCDQLVSMKKHQKIQKNNKKTYGKFIGTTCLSLLIKTSTRLPTPSFSCLEKPQSIQWQISYATLRINPKRLEDEKRMQKDNNTMQ